MSSTKFDIEKFDGKNDFNLWKMKLEAILIQQGVEKALLPESELPMAMSDQERMSIQKKAFSSIILCLADQVLRKVSHVKTVSELWRKLEDLYRQKTLPNRIYLKEKFFGYKMDEVKSIDDNLDEFNKLILDLENLEVKIEDEDKAIILLNSLPKSLKSFKETLKYGRETITVDEVQSALSSKILDMKISETNHQGEGLHVRGRSQERGNNFKNWKSKSRSKSTSKKDYSNVKCWQCNKTGHIRRFCSERFSKDDFQSQGDAAIVGENYDSVDVLFVGNHKNSTEWILDSGCTYHVSYIREWFSNYQSLNGEKVLLGNNKACDVIGIGSIAIKMHDGQVRILKDVRHVPDLKRNLISLGTLDNSGCVFRSEKGLLIISKGALVIMEGFKQDGLYVLQGATMVGETHVTAKSGLGKTKLWHQRLEHLCDRGLIELQKQDLFDSNSDKNCYEFEVEPPVYTQKEEAEYITVIDDVKESVWLQDVLSELGAVKLTKISTGDNLSDLDTKFVDVLNSKKAKLRELRDRLSKIDGKAPEDDESSDKTDRFDGGSDGENAIEIFRDPGSDSPDASEGVGASTWKGRQRTR